MPTRPDSPDPTGQNPNDPHNPFAGLGSGMGAGLGFFQDWLKAAGSALPNLSGTTGAQGAAMPAWSMPTLDPEELDKRIQDLKTVQFWLEQNARMIAMSIQGLEVQRMTLSTLQGMNVSMDALRESLKAKPSASAWGSPPAQAPSPAPAPATAAPRASWAASPPAQPAPPPSASPAPEDAGGSDDAPSAPAGADEASAADATLINPMRWWDTLTQQFTHLAAQAAQTVGDSVGAASQASAKKSPGKAKTTAKSAGTGSASSTTAKRPAAKKARAASPSPRARSTR